MWGISTLGSNPLTFLKKFKTLHNMVTVTMVSFAPKFAVSKDPSMADEPVQLTISDLKRNQKYTLHASVRLPNSSVFESFAHYIADDEGCIDVDQHKCLGGDYTGVEPMGPLSFMKPSALNKRKHERFMIKEPSHPFQVDFRLFDGFFESLSDELAIDRFRIKPCFTITRTYMADGVKEVPVWHGNVRATLYLPPGEGPFPGIISMSGGYPGAMKYKAALLASHGYAALALKYFGEDDLPENYSVVKIEYIEEAIRFLANHPSVSGEQGVGIIANCYGGTIALAAVSVLPKKLIRCVVSINGWSFPNALITYKGKNIVSGPPPVLNISLDKNGVRIWKFDFPEIAKNDDVKSSSLPCFKSSDVSHLFVAGENDGYVPAERLSVVTRQFFVDARHPDFEILYYKGAGHLIEHNFYPLASVAYTFHEPHFNGGEQPGHSMAQNDSWPKILDFVQKRLSPSISKL